MVKKKIMQCLQLGWKINDSFQFDSFFGLVVEGRQRIGKSSYVSQALAEAEGRYEYDPVIRSVTQDYDAIKKWIVFRPKEFLDRVLSIKDKAKCLIWDDAGFWLFALDWYEAFVKTVARYIQLCGRQFGCLILTSPSQKMISGKVLEALPDMLVCRIREEGMDSLRIRPREARVFRRWDYPDGKKGGVRKLFVDHFNAISPDDYWKWYRPKSDEYMAIGLSILKREVTKMTRKLDKGEIEDQVHDVEKVVGDPDKLIELQEVIANLEKSKAV